MSDTGIVLTTATRAGWDVVTYAGPLSEDSALPLGQLLPGLGARVVFDLERVTYVNSNGVRTWVLFLRELRQGREVAYERCSPAVLTQLNMIPSFRTGVHVRSVHVPWTCGACNNTDVILFHEADFSDALAHSPARPCSRCAERMSLDDAIEEYFGFAAR